MNEKLQRIHDAMCTDGARAAVQFADTLIAAANTHENPIDAIKEARQWIAAALAIDKAAADGNIADLQSKFAAKAQRKSAAANIEKRREERTASGGVH